MIKEEGCGQGEASGGRLDLRRGGKITPLGVGGDNIRNTRPPPKVGGGGERNLSRKWGNKEVLIGKEATSRRCSTGGDLEGTGHRRVHPSES